MSQQETLIEEAIKFARDKGIQINRGGAVFNWCKHNTNNDSSWSVYPVSCNALGAILIKLGKENLVKEEFDPSWLKAVCDYLNVDPFWLNRFVHGFDYGTQITLIRVTEVDKKKKETPELDKISQMGLKLANRYAKETS
jgi:hypothetical protein